MCSAAGRPVAAGFGSVSTSTLVSAAEAAVAVAPLAVLPVISGGKGAARFVAAGVAVSVDSSAMGGVAIERWEAGQLPARAPRWGSAAPNVSPVSTTGAAGAVTSAVMSTATSSPISSAAEAPSERKSASLSKSMSKNWEVASSSCSSPSISEKWSPITTCMCRWSLVSRSVRSQIREGIRCREHARLQ